MSDECRCCTGDCWCSDDDGCGHQSQPALFELKERRSRKEYQDRWWSQDMGSCSFCEHPARDHFLGGPGSSRCQVYGCECSAYVSVHYEPQDPDDAA